MYRNILPIRCFIFFGWKYCIADCVSCRYLMFEATYIMFCSTLTALFNTVLQQNFAVYPPEWLGGSSGGVLKNEKDLLKRAKSCGLWLDVPSKLVWTQYFFGRVVYCCRKVFSNLFLANWQIFLGHRFHVVLEKNSISFFGETGFLCSKSCLLAYDIIPSLNSHLHCQCAHQAH